MCRTRNFLRAELEKNPRELFTGPVLVVCHFRLPIKSGESFPGEHKSRSGLPHCCRPDGDNMEKFLHDCFTGLIWKDDCAVAWMLRSKTWTHEKDGSTSIFVTEIPNTKPEYDLLCKNIIDNINVGEFRDAEEMPRIKSECY